MRIIWNETENYFQAEFTQGELWREDMESAKLAGLKTSGPPAWQWYTSKASVLNSLRDLKPKSGLIITETALEKYKSRSEQEQKKSEIKKQFEKAKRAAKKTEKINENNYVDPDTGIVCITVPEVAAKAWTYVAPEIPHEICFICDAAVYFYERVTSTPICAWCDKELISNNA